jgi:hypothetical protein
MTKHIPSTVNTIFILSSTVLVAIAANANILLAIVLSMVLLVALHASSSNFKFGNKTRQLMTQAKKNVAPNVAKTAAKTVAQTVAQTVEGFSTRPAPAYAEPVKILEDESAAATDASPPPIAANKLASEHTVLSLNDSASSVLDPNTGEIPEIESYAMKDSSLISTIQYQPFIPIESIQLPPAAEKKKRDTIAMRQPELLELDGVDDSDKLYAGIKISEDGSCYQNCSRLQTAHFTDLE